NVVYVAGPVVSAPAGAGAVAADHVPGGSCTGCAVPVAPASAMPGVAGSPPGPTADSSGSVTSSVRPFIPAAADGPALPPGTAGLPGPGIPAPGAPAATALAPGPEAAAAREAGMLTSTGRPDRRPPNCPGGTVSGVAAGAPPVSSGVAGTVAPPMEVCACSAASRSRSSTTRWSEGPIRSSASQPISPTIRKVASPLRQASKASSPLIRPIPPAINESAKAKTMPPAKICPRVFGALGRVGGLAIIGQLPSGAAQSGRAGSPVLADPGPGGRGSRTSRRAYSTAPLHRGGAARPPPGREYRTSGQ